MKLFNVKYFALVCSMILLFMNCETAKHSVPNSSSLDFSIIESGAYGGISTPSHQLVKNKKDFDSLFSELHKNIFPNIPMEYSSTKDYIFITFGEKSSGGLDYSIDKIQKVNHTIIVTLHTLKKQESSFSTSAIASPYVVVEINRTNSDKVDLKIE